MKKILLLLAVMLTSVVAASASNIFGHNAAVLPVSAQTVLKKNFKSEVSLVKVDRTLGRITEYEVIMTDGSEVTFDRSGNWKEVEVRRAAQVPASFIPGGVTTYVKKYQKGANVIGIEKKRDGYEVELSNGVEMKFSKDGKFVRYGD